MGIYFLINQTSKVDLDPLSTTLVYYLNAKNQENPLSSFGKKLATTNELLTNYVSDLIGSLKLIPSQEIEKLRSGLPDQQIGQQTDHRTNKRKDRGDYYGVC